ncbi:MAG: hypothetical protein U5L11_15580 [Arhodomonas sp.]|nr:hypothetical protein [Arhodomonas sp.]
MVEQIDFRRGPDGAGRVLIRLNASDAPVNIERQGSMVIADLEGVFTPERLRRRLDVTDFATPVTTIETRQRNGTTRVTVEAAERVRAGGLPGGRDLHHRAQARSPRRSRRRPRSR